MKRFHVHVAVRDLDASVRFYSSLFASAPAVHETDYAKWMLEDPQVNFAISTGARDLGVNHLGIQAETAEELAELGVRLDAAGGAVQPQPGAVCCYARSDKAWTEDPQGTRWETFHTLGEATVHHGADTACGDASGCAPTPLATQPTIVAGAACRPGSNCC